jgi:hypothetical protein
MMKEDAIAVLGSIRALADLLGISVHAIYQWGPAVPRLREYEIREKIPDFDAKLAALPRRPDQDQAAA